MAELPFRLLSEFYLHLWGELDVLFDEHRWIRAVGKKLPERTAQTILTELLEQKGVDELPVSTEQLRKEYEHVEGLVKEWKASNPKVRERLEFRRKFEAKRAYLQEKALAFGSLVPSRQLGL